MSCGEGQDVRVSGLEMTESRVSTPRVQPRVWIGIVIWLAYVLLVLIMGKLSGFPYTHLEDNGGSLFLFGVGISLMVVALIINLFSTDWGAYEGTFFVASIVQMLVGFTEEMATRGLLIAGLRSRFG